MDARSLSAPQPVLGMHPGPSGSVKEACRDVLVDTRTLEGHPGGQSAKENHQVSALLEFCRGLRGNWAQSFLIRPTSFRAKLLPSLLQLLLACPSA